MSLYYPDDYGPHLGTRVVEMVDRRPAWRRHISRVVGRLMNTNADRIPPVPPGRLLEIGCASGSYLHKMSSAGWAVEGIELPSLAAERARLSGHKVHVGAVESAPDPDQRFDLVVAWMVLEHLHDPVLALQRIHDWTKPGGWLVASVPNADCWEFRVFGSAWYALHLPNHLWHPTKETLRMVLETWVGGMFPRVGAWLKAFPGRGGRLSQILFPVAWLLAFLGQTGHMTTWARRQD